MRWTTLRRKFVYGDSASSGFPMNAVVSDWFARPVLFVKDIDRAVEFYVERLGFVRSWRYEEEEKALVAQVSTRLCADSFFSVAEKVGTGLMFISLDVAVPHALRAELEGKGVDVKDGYWGDIGDIRSW